MKENFSWKIECNHTPETIDRILMPIRKRGLSVINLSYQKVDAKNAVCTILLELEPEECDKIYKNLIRIHDIHNVVKL